MAKSITQRILDQSAMMVAREVMKNLIKTIKPKIKTIAEGGENKNPSGRRNKDA